MPSTVRLQEISETKIPAPIPFIISHSAAAGFAKTNRALTQSLNDGTIVACLSADAACAENLETGPSKLEKARHIRASDGQLRKLSL